MIDIRIEERSAYTVVRLAGELRGESAAQFSQSLQGLASIRDRAIAIDLSGVTGIDSSGLGSLIHLVARANVSEVRIVLVAPTPFVEGILRVTRLEDWFEICGSLDEAAELLRA